MKIKKIKRFFSKINMAEPNDELFDIFDKNSYKKIGVEKRGIVNFSCKFLGTPKRIFT
jgi:hypothetical protein